MFTPMEGLLAAGLAVMILVALVVLGKNISLQQQATELLEKVKKGTEPGIVDHQHTTDVDVFLNLHNALRLKAGLQPLKQSIPLEILAENQAKAMATKKVLSHAVIGYLHERLLAGNYKYKAAAENIACGQRTVAEVFESWVNSPGHKANILNRDLTEVGFAAFKIVNNFGNTVTTYWCAIFATPADFSTPDAPPTTLTYRHYSGDTISCMAVIVAYDKQTYLGHDPVK